MRPTSQGAYPRCGTYCARLVWDAAGIGVRPCVTSTISKSGRLQLRIEACTLSILQGCTSKGYKTLAAGVTAVCEQYRRGS